MSIVDGEGALPGGQRSEAWEWWQARRLSYTLALAAAGLAAYAVALGILAAFGNWPWSDARGWLGSTLALGTGFLVIIGAANVLYLLGPLSEAWLKPADRDGYRRSAYAMGFWGSVALPFLFPLMVLAVAVGEAGAPV